MKRTMIFVFLVSLLLCMPACQQADTTDMLSDETEAPTTEVPIAESPATEAESKQETKLPIEGGTEPSSPPDETEAALDDGYCIAPRRYASMEEFLTQFPITGQLSDFGVKETTLAIPVFKSDRYKLYSIEETSTIFRFFYVAADDNPTDYYTPEYGYVWDNAIIFTCWRDDHGYRQPTFGQSYPFKQLTNTWHFYENSRWQDVTFPEEIFPDTREELHELFEFEIYEFPDSDESSPAQ